jgi:hypothetical protein
MLVQIFYKYNMHDRHFFFNPSAFILMFKMSGKEFQGLGQNDRDKCVIISTNILQMQIIRTEVIFSTTLVRLY